MATSRNFKNNGFALSVNELSSVYNNTLRKVCNMIEKQGPIYSTWIRFHIGHNKPIIFDTSSTNNKENLIADLRMEKSGNGIANTFTLTVRYDPFNFGQNTQDKIEALDDLLARAMIYDLGDTDNLDNLEDLHGYIQYGYNYTEDANLVSPKYVMMITDAKSRVEWSSGITTYTFEGCSFLALDCEFTADFDAVAEEDNKGLIDYVNETLYYYYGDSAHKPSHISSDETYGGSFRYRIVIPEKLFEDQPTFTADAVTGISPWTYCKNLLQGKMSKSDAENETYKDSATIIKPRYSMFISDANQTIYVNYVSPLNDKYIEKVDYTFTWSTDLTTNIVTSWNPQVDLKQYLIQRATKARTFSQNLTTYDSTVEVANTYETEVKTDSTSTKKQNTKIPNYRLPVSNPLFSSKVDVSQLPDPSEIRFQGPLYSNSSKSTSTTNTADVNTDSTGQEVVEGYKNDNDEINSEVYEMYDAELETIGIPADPVLLAEVKVVPRILESVSRTAGYYIIQGCTDEIDNRGRYTSTLKLFRMKNL